MKLIFAVLDVPLTMGLTRCYKTKGFLHLYLQFLYIFHAISNRYIRLRMRKSICITNFDEIPQSTAQIKLLPVSDDGWPPYWHFTSNIHTYLQFMSIMLHPPAKFRRNRKKNIRRTFDVISIFQDGAHGVGNLLLSSGLVTDFVQNGENLCAYQIWMRYLNPLLK